MTLIEKITAAAVIFLLLCGWAGWLLYRLALRGTELAPARHAASPAGPRPAQRWMVTCVICGSRDEYDRPDPAERTCGHWSDQDTAAADDAWAAELHRMNREPAEPPPAVQQWDFTQWETDRLADLDRVRASEANVWDLLATRQLADAWWTRGR